LRARKKSSNTVEIKSANPELVGRAVGRYTKWLFQSFREVLGVFWFGSWVSGIPTPGSDVDLCIVLDSAESAFRDRLPKYLPDGFPVGLDIFPYTKDELQRMATERPEWHRTITSGKLIAPRRRER
jgi:predicted nucleotidyltransferase